MPDTMRAMATPDANTVMRVQIPVHSYGKWSKRLARQLDRGRKGRVVVDVADHWE